MVKNDTIPTSLPLLDYVENICSLENRALFRGYKVLAVQHLLGSTIPFFTMIEKGGVKPRDIYIIGKAYSSHPMVVKRLKRKGYNVNFETVFNFLENKPYDSILERHILEIIKKLIKKIGKFQKILIIDDGGKAIKILHEKYAKKSKHFTCVEQTSRGARVVSNLKLKCPVINVARSRLKTIYESPLISKAMVSELLNLLKHWEKLEIFRFTNKRILLLGYGFIGQRVAETLRKKGFHITVYDPDEKQLIKARNDKFTIVRDRSRLYKSIDILIGSSGTQVFSGREFQKLRYGTLLVNMASSDIEFAAWNLRPKGKIIYQHILPTDKKYLKHKMPLPWRSLYQIDLKKTRLYLANGGFPIDFCGKINPIPAKDIQLTSSLLLLGAIQAVNTKKIELVKLDTTLQKKILDRYLKSKKLGY